MFTNVSAILAAHGGLSFLGGAAPELPASFWEGILAPVTVLAVVVMALGFLFLVGRLSWAAREFVQTCRERQRAHRKLVETLSDFVENQNLGVDQLWSASAALSAC
ncbi:MAG TPA: hypothetical protein VL523_08935 [Terriglobia bacterium]|nr:hypothetical protein [Terriglobia bacterium]